MHADILGVYPTGLGNTGTVGGGGVVHDGGTGSEGKGRTATALVDSSIVLCRIAGYRCVSDGNSGGTAAVYSSSVIRGGVAGYGRSIDAAFRCTCNVYTSSIRGRIVSDGPTGHGEYGITVKSDAATIYVG